jgi:hypothetical protein
LYPSVLKKDFTHAATWLGSKLSKETSTMFIPQHLPIFTLPMFASNLADII